MISEATGTINGTIENGNLNAVFPLASWSDSYTSRKFVYEFVLPVGHRLLIDAETNFESASSLSIASENDGLLYCPGDLEAMFNHHIWRGENKYGYSQSLMNNHDEELKVTFYSLNLINGVTGNLSCYW